MRKLEFSGQNQCQLLHNGEEYFPQLIKAIDDAQVEIFLETYIFAHDVSAQAVQEALGRAAERGVQVQVIIDWIGCGEQSCNRLQTQLSESGVACRVFNPWFKRGWARTHRKLVVIDEKIGFVGGINIVDDYHAENDAMLKMSNPRWDFAVQVQGPLIAQMHAEVQAQWQRLGHLKLLSRLLLTRRLRQSAVASKHETGLAAFVVRDNFRNRSTIQQAYLKALGSAKTLAYFANPYFAPGRKLRLALISAARRGVDVRLLLGVGDFHLQDAVAQTYYPNLLANGIKIYEYRKSKLHAKVAVIDDDWATVGSSNFDGLSLFVNQEANIVIKDEHFAAHLKTLLQQGIEEAEAVEGNALQHQNFVRKIINRVAHWIYRLILHVASGGQYH